MPNKYPKDRLPDQTKESRGGSGGKDYGGWEEGESAFGRTKGEWADSRPMPDKDFNDSVKAYQGDQLGSEGFEHSKK